MKTDHLVQISLTTLKNNYLFISCILFQIVFVSHDKHLSVMTRHLLCAPYTCSGIDKFTYQRDYCTYVRIYGILLWYPALIVIGG